MTWTFPAYLSVSHHFTSEHAISFLPKLSNILFYRDFIIIKKIVILTWDEVSIIY